MPATRKCSCTLAGYSARALRHKLHVHVHVFAWPGWHTTRPRSVYCGKKRLKRPLLKAWVTTRYVLVYTCTSKMHKSRTYVYVLGRVRLLVYICLYAVNLSNTEAIHVHVNVRSVNTLTELGKKDVKFLVCEEQKPRMAFVSMLVHK